MRAAVTTLWAASAVMGAYLLARLARGGLRQQATRITVFPVVVVFAHPLLALAGLGCWIGYLVTADVAAAWAAFGCLCLAALLGFTLFTRWLIGRGGRHARGAQGSPFAAVAVHGALGVATFVLVLLVASGAGHR